MQVLWSFWSGFSESKWCDYFLLTNTNTKLLKEEGKKKEKKKNQNKACTQKSRAALPSQFKTKPWNLSERRRVGEKTDPKHWGLQSCAGPCRRGPFSLHKHSTKGMFSTIWRGPSVGFHMQYWKSPEHSTAGFVHYACSQRPSPICSIKSTGYYCSTRCSVDGHWYISLKEKLKERQSDPKKKEHQPVLSLPVSFVQWDS